MIIRALCLVAGLSGAAATSQFPEFSQQYAQRLGGAVDALGDVVADFDASAQAAGLTRDAALAQLQGTTFLDSRRTDMSATFARYDKLRADLELLEGKGPFMRAYHLPRLTDSQIAAAAWDVYEPAVPLNFAGIVFAAFGFIFGGGLVGALLKLISWPMRRKAA